MYFMEVWGIACSLVFLQVYSGVHASATVTITPSLPQENYTTSEETLRDNDGDLTEILQTKISDSCDTQKLMAHIIMKEIEERKTIQVEFDRRIKEMENITTFLDSHISVLQGQVRQLRQKAPVVAFSARVSKHLDNLQPKQTIVFGSVFTNVGSAYDANSGKFRCPVSGLYQFYVGILSKANQRIETELVVNGQNRLLIYASSEGGHHGSLASNTVILELQKDDSVWVRVHYYFGEYVHCCWSTFSGHLLNAN